MSKQADARSPHNGMTPTCLRVRDWLLAYIRRHNLEAGDKIPSERKLADALGISRLTVAKALKGLVEQGMLVQQSRSGTFVGELTKRPRSGTRTITVINARSGEINECSHTFLHDITRGASSVLAECGYRMVVHDYQDAGEEAELLAGLPNEHSDGAIIFPYLLSDGAAAYAKLTASYPPVVLVDHYFPNLPLDRVVTDNFGGARDGVRLLIARGHRRIAFLTGREDVTSVTDRIAGYRAALEEADIPYDDDIVCGPLILPRGRLSHDIVLEHLLRIPDPITAVFATNDNIVWMVLQAATKLVLSIPNDLQLAGFFDAHIPEGVQTPFIRIIQPKVEIGRAAARLLLDRITGRVTGEPQHIEIPPIVIE